MQQPIPRAAARCRFCGGPTTPRSNGETPVSCAKAECRKQAYQGRHLTDNVGWPQRTGEVVAEFWRHNIVPGDEYGAAPMRPATIVPSQSGIA